MPVKSRDMEWLEHAWIREYLPVGQAGMFMPGGALDELMWLYQVDMGHGGYQLIEGVIKPDLSLTTAPELRRHFLDRYDQIVTLLEGAKFPFAKLPELTLTAKFYRPPTEEPRFVEFEAHVRIELFP